MKWRGSLLFFLLSFYFTTTVSGQLISFSVKNEPLEKVFLLIEQQSGHHFVYSDETIQKSRPVSLSVTKETLFTVLEKCFIDQPLSYKLNEKNITVKEKRTAVIDHSLKGRVVDENGNPVSGVTVSIKGTPMAVATDSNGEFAFPNAPPNAVLVLSSVQIEPMEQFVGSREFVEIKVNIKVGLLDETIVIAYGETNRRKLIGTVSRIKSDEINRSPVSNPISSLSGRVPGLQILQKSGIPGSYVVVRLRGQNSIANGNEPLYIVDGVPFPSESMSGVFGGAGGVVSSPLNTLNPDDIESIEVLKDADATAIFGSRGANGVILISTKKGKPGKARFDVGFYTGAGRITRFIDLLNTSEYISMRKEAFQNDGTLPNTSNARDLLLWDTTRYTDWQKMLIGNSMSVQDARVSYSGGITNTQFRTGIGYRRETTVYPGDFFLQKYSFSTNLSHRSRDTRFSLSISSEININKSELPTLDLSTQITLPPNAPAIYDNEGNLNWENSTWTNPYGLLKQIFNASTDRLYSGMNIGYMFLPGLKANINLGYTTIHNTDHAVTPSTYYDPAYNLPGMARFGETSLKTLIAEPQLNYRKKIRNINLEILSGVTLQSTMQKGIYQAGLGYTSDELLGSLKAASTIITASETEVLYRYAGLFNRLSVTLKDRYLANITIRRDGSSRYGEDNRFANFGSIGFGWIFSEESWIKKQSWLSFGKLKTSLGVTGNDQIGDYKYLDLYAPASNPYLNNAAFIPQQLYNPDFGWERVFKFEAGLELGMLSNHLYLTLNYYNNTTTNQLVSYPLPVMTGFNGILKNIPARIRNRGLEIEFTSDNWRKGKWNWSSGFNLTIPHNRLLAYDGLKSSSYANYYAIGHSLFIVKKYQNTGVDPSKGNYTFIDFDKDGRISAPNDQQTIIFTGQQYFGGLENTITYNKISLNFLFQFVKQKNGYNYLSRFANRPGSYGNQPVWIMNRWRQEGDNALIQRFVNSSSDANIAYSQILQSNAAYSNASFIRLRNLNISIDLLSDKWKNKGINELKLNLQGHNLLTITRYLGLDPETNSLLPPIKMITAGIKFSF